MFKEHWWNDIDRGKPKYSEKRSVLVLRFPLQISQRLAWRQTRASMEGRRRLAAELGTDNTIVI
jgi:hypothetical protein